MANWEEEGDGEGNYTFDRGDFQVYTNAKGSSRSNTIFHLDDHANSSEEAMQINVTGNQVKLSRSPAPGELEFLEDSLRNIKGLPRKYHGALRKAVESMKREDYGFFDLAGEPTSRERAHESFIERRKAEFGAGLSDGLNDGLAFEPGEES